MTQAVSSGTASVSLVEGSGRENRRAAQNRQGKATWAHLNGRVPSRYQCACDIRTADRTVEKEYRDLDMVQTCYGVAWRQQSDAEHWSGGWLSPRRSVVQARRPYDIRAKPIGAYRSREQSLIGHPTVRSLDRRGYRLGHEQVYPSFALCCAMAWMVSRHLLCLG